MLKCQQSSLNPREVVTLDDIYIYIIKDFERNNLTRWNIKQSLGQKTENV